MNRLLCWLRGHDYRVNGWSNLIQFVTGHEVSQCRCCGKIKRTK